MAIFRWVEIANPASRERYQFLSETLKKHGIDNEIQFLECAPDAVSATLAHAEKEFDQIIIGTPFREQLTATFKELPALILSTRSADCLVKDSSGRWWPRCILYEAVIRELALQVKGLDFNSTALIVGAGGAARAVIAALVKVGFDRFSITDQFSDRAQSTISSLRKSYFGIEFTFVPHQAITTLPGIHSLMVNTTPLVPSNELLNELYYFNFLRPPGAVIDLTLIPADTPLLKEARQMGATVVHGYQMAAQVDFLWTKMVRGIELNVSEYTEGLKAKLDQIPFDLTPFLPESATDLKKEEPT